MKYCHDFTSGSMGNVKRQGNGQARKGQKHDIFGQGTPCLPEARGSCSWFADMQSHCKLHNARLVIHYPIYSLESKRPFRNSNCHASHLADCISGQTLSCPPSLPALIFHPPNSPNHVPTTCTPALPARNPWHEIQICSLVSHATRCSFQNAQTCCLDE